MRRRKIGNQEIIKYPDDTEETIVVSSEHLGEAIEVIKTYDFKNVSIESNYKKINIDFLKDCPSIEVLQISNTNIKDFDGLTRLKNLQMLSLNVNQKIKIDIGELAELKQLNGGIPTQMSGFDKLSKLTRVELFGYKPVSKSLVELSGISNLEALVLSQGNIETLMGIEKMSNIKEINLFGMRKLTDISALQSTSASIKSFSLENCKSIKNMYEIGYLRDLIILRLLDCGSISSLSFIENLVELESLVFDGTTIMDGDLHYCEKLEYVYFNQKKHYSHKLKDLNSEL